MAETPRPPSTAGPQPEPAEETAVTREPLTQQLEVERDSGSESAATAAPPLSLPAADNQGWQDLAELLAKTKARNLALKEWRNPITVPDRESVAHAFRTLVNEDIMCAPSVQADGKFSGWMSMLDLAKLAVQLLHDIDRRTSPSSKLLEANRQFAEARVVDLQTTPGIAKELCDPEVSVWTLLATLRKGPVHSIAVLDPPTNRVLFVITRSMLVYFINATLQEMDAPVLRTPVSRIRPYRELVRMFDTECTLDAIGLLCEDQATGISLVDSQGALSGMLSLRDLRGIGPEPIRIEKLWEQLKGFKEKIQLERVQTPKEPVQLSSNATLGEVLQAVLENQVHRVVIVSKAGVPIDLIELADILKYAYDRAMLQPGSSQQQQQQ